MGHLLDILKEQETIPVSPHWLWRFKYDFKYDGTSLQEHCGKLIDHTIQNTGTGAALETGNAFSTAYNVEHQPHFWEIMQPFINHMQPYLHALWNHWDYGSGQPVPIRSWINTHKRSGMTMEHHHNGCPLVISAYLKHSTNSGYFQFRDPYEYHRWGSPGEPQLDLWKTVAVGEGDVLVFPGWLKHRTEPSQSDDDRVCLAIMYGGND